jgi:hypothetical protein
MAFHGGAGVNGWNRGKNNAFTAQGERISRAKPGHLVVRKPWPLDLHAVERWLFQIGSYQKNSPSEIAEPA